jgi:hypothetical protein
MSVNKQLRVEIVEFNGVVFRRYPDSPRYSDRKYFKPSGDGHAKGIENLHREVWKFHYGPIPPGYDIHHKDLDTANNAKENFEMLPKAAHRELHDSLGLHTDKRRSWIDKIRPLASAWHGSEAGRAWHSQHAKNIGFGKRDLVVRRCGQCGKRYPCGNTALGKFCSNKCKSAARRAAGVDDIMKQCEKCGNAFLTNKYDKTTHCSRQCAGAGTYVRPEIDKICNQCHEKFISNSPKAMYCSNKCRKRFAAEKRKLLLL